MKKLIVSSAALLLIVTAGIAQDVSFGAKAGINVSNQKFTSGSGGGSQTGDSKVGLAIGGFAEIGVSDNFAIQPELLYSQMGTKDKSTSFTVNVDYIAIPVLAKYRNSGFGVYAGPQIGILANAKYKGGGSSISAKDDYKSIDFDGVFGAEYTFEPGIVISARYLFGLANIAKTGTNSNYESGDKVTNSAFNITVGYVFGGSGKKK
jgi:Outer membrane protein beta-barrel domain